MKSKKAEAKAAKGKHLRQVGALPYRVDDDGNVKFLLVTSRGTSRFVIPKGWPMKGLSDGEAAAREAREEAGIVGTPAQQPVGSYFYWKRMKRVFVPIVVDVYPLEVVKEMKRWRERHERQREWLTPSQAAALVDEPELVSLIEQATGLLSVSL